MSAWFISLTGLVWLTLIRDALIACIILATLPAITKQRNWLIYTALAFIGFTLLSVFWRDPSLAQWAKGFRFIISPIVLFTALSSITFQKNQRQIILRVIWAIGLGIALIALFQLVGVKIPLVTEASDFGALESPHRVGELMLYRVQSILAGPNALGLFMFVVLVAGLNLFQTTKTKFILLTCMALLLLVLVMTFSRSSWLGIVFSSGYLVWQYLKLKTGSKILPTLTLFAFFALAAVGGYLLTINNYAAREVLIHGSSSPVRIEQYQRIWRDKFDIGLFGQGTGTAGLASQYRLDDGTNQFTENIYLDMFQELGLIGLTLYLAFLLSTWYRLQTLPATHESRILRALFVSFCFIGLFISTYTGQLAAFAFWILLGIHINGEVSVTQKRAAAR